MTPKPLKNHRVQWSVTKKVVNGDGQRGAKPSKKIYYSLTDNLNSRDASASKKRLSLGPVKAVSTLQQWVALWAWRALV